MTLLTSNNVIIDALCSKALFLLLSPLVLFWVLLLFGRVVRRFRGVVATGFMFVNTIVAFLLFISIADSDVYSYKFDWVNLIDFKLEFGLQVDALSALFALIVCFVSFLVHLFSIEYLRGDKNFEKYFAYLSLFTFSMLGIIFSGNLLQLFIFWELVGFSSYLLIGFWFENSAAVVANKKAFLVNRVGDVGFLMGILILFSLTNTLDIEQLQSYYQSIKVSNDIDFSYFITDSGVVSKGWLIVAALGVSSGALAKSAQFPFSLWLPSAMEGPTPVSALIHAATMVAAGIYLLARFTFLMPEFVLDVLAVIGTITAVMAAITAITQTDIKRVLAFSTISQLGYMVLSIGVQSYESALFHLLTHAFFKAGLFLCAGAIIHSLHKMDTAYGIKKLYPDFDEQNMKQMGGLRKKMPMIFWIYTVALCGIIGMPMFTGFLSKDAILLNAFNWGHSKGGLFYLIPLGGVLTVGLTSFYMLRQWFLVFFGENRMATQVTGAPLGINTFVIKESLGASIVMIAPPFILALLTLAPVFSLNPLDSSNSWVYSKLPHIQFLNVSDVNHYFSHFTVSLFSLALMFIGAFLSYLMFQKGKLVNLKPTTSPVSSNMTSNIFHKISYNFWYMDDVVNKVLLVPTMRVSKYASLFDKHVIDNIAHLAVGVNKRLGAISSTFDSKIIDSIIKVIGVLNVIFGLVFAWIDKNILDGIVKFIAWLGMKIGGIAKQVHKGKVQGYIVWSFIFMFLVFMIIYLIR